MASQFPRPTCFCEAENLSRLWPSDNDEDDDIYGGDDDDDDVS